METVSAFLLGGLVIGMFLYTKGKNDAGYEVLRRVSNVTVSGDRSFFNNWYVAYISDNKVRYDICASKDTQAIIDLIPKGGVYAYGTLDHVEIFCSPDELVNSIWGSIRRQSDVSNSQESETSSKNSTSDSLRKQRSAERRAQYPIPPDVEADPQLKKLWLAVMFQ